MLLNNHKIFLKNLLSVSLIALKPLLKSFLPILEGCYTAITKTFENCSLYRMHIGET